MLRGCFAIGIGLVLAQTLQSNLAYAGTHESKWREARHRIDRRHEIDRRHDEAVARRDSKALTSLKKEVHDLRQQVASVDALRKELTDLRERISGPTASFGLGFAPRPQSVAVVEPKQVTLKLPDLSIPERTPHAPVNPATASLPAVIEERATEQPKGRSAVEEAKAYLIDTASPGYTMTRQGVSLSIERLHPEFIVKLAEAIKLAREAGMSNAGLFSAYRPPSFGIGGFSDKFNSLHSYGLAVDMTGIGGAGSKLAHLWQTLVRKVGLYLPYGPDNRKEFNHTQLIPTKVASAALRRTITGSAPKDLRTMWLASGITTHVDEVTGAPAPTLAASASIAHKLPPLAPPPAQGEATAAPRRARRSGTRKGSPRQAAASKSSARASTRTRTAKTTKTK